VSATVGTTTELVRGQFGPFSLIDTPGHLPDIQSDALQEASAIVYLIDATQGIRSRDVATITQLKLAEKPVVVVLNKIDLLKGDPDEVAADAAAHLHVADVIPVCARTGERVGDELIPAMIETSPEAALTLGRALPRYRREAAARLVRAAAMVSLVAGLEPIPLVDIPVLLGVIRCGW